LVKHVGFVRAALEIKARGRGYRTIPSVSFRMVLALF
jgi:hypothetical protein